MLRLWTACQNRIIRDEEGAGMVEYALLVGLIGILLVAALAAFRVGVGTNINKATIIFST